MTFDPFAIGVLTAAMVLYLCGYPKAPVPRSEALAAAAGWLILAVALLSPIATFSELLFSVHMTQHELLMLVAAPLIAFGRPGVPMLRALPLGWRQRIGAATSIPVVSALMEPAGAFFMHAVALWVWHLPVLYEAAVRSTTVHLVQHLCFTGTACLFWWALIRGRYGRIGYGAAVVFVFATMVHSGALGALLTFTRQPIYGVYVTRASTLDIDPLADQELAGVLMWIPAGLVLLLLAVAFFMAWLRAAERRHASSGDRRPASSFAASPPQSPHPRC